MKTRTQILMCGALSGIIASTLLTGCCSTAKKTAALEPAGAENPAPAAATKVEKLDFLFVQTATNVSFENGTMTLHGISPLTVCFTDRPERMAGHMPTTNTVPMWGEGKNSFTADPPNATLSVMNGNTVSNVVVVLSNPQFSGDDLTYEIRLLEGTPPAEGGPCSLFIDIIGMPLTPFSYAGAARRAARRGYYYNGYYGPAVVTYGAPVVAVPPPVVVPAPAVVY